jgi:hypothetical protein
MCCMGSASAVCAEAFFVSYMHGCHLQTSVCVTKKQEMSIALLSVPLYPIAPLRQDSQRCDDALTIEDRLSCAFHDSTVCYCVEVYILLLYKRVFSAQLCDERSDLHSVALLKPRCHQQ